MASNFDIAILGGGPAGYPAALKAARLGKSVVLIDSGGLGGTCLHRGCIPTKTWVAAAERVESAISAIDYGVTGVSAPGIDIGLLRKKTDTVIRLQEDGVAAKLKKAGVTVIDGFGKFVSGNSMEVNTASGTESVAFSSAIIATGSQPARPGVFAKNLPGIYTTDNIFSIEALPEKLLIAGGGVIGCEFASMLSLFGVSVEVVELMGRILPLEDEEISKTVARELKKRKVGLHTGQKVVSLDLKEPGFHVVLDTGKTIDSDAVLVAIGRAPSTDGIGLEKAGVEVTERGWVKTDSSMQTTNPAIFAAGDVAGKMQTAYSATAEGEIAAHNAAGVPGGSVPAEMDYECIPSAIFTIPEAASAGITESVAAERGLNPKTAIFQIRQLGKAHAAGHIAGFVKLVAVGPDGRLAGCQMVCSRATDIIHEAALAIRNGMTVRTFLKLVHAHPTFAESLAEAALAFE